MAVKGVKLSEFSVFENLALEFSPGINVLIGVNGTGKTHLLKVLYALLRSIEGVTPEEARKTFRERLGSKLTGVFRPDSIGRLVHRRHGINKGRVVAELDEGQVRFSVHTHNKLSLGVAIRAPVHGSALFIPSRETLSIYEGFVSLYANREVAFDETYYDLCLALGAPALRGPRGLGASRLIAPIERALGGRVLLEGDRFYVKTDHGKFEAHLMSEGLRKIATLARLITNGSLAEKSILFWDEPEANLNPKLARELVEFLRHLSEQKVQIFLATHDTLVAQRVSLATEYGLRPTTPTRFIGLYRDSAGVVRADSGQVLADLAHNPILEEFTRFADDERRAFEESVSGGGT